MRCVRTCRARRALLPASLAALALLAACRPGANAPAAPAPGGGQGNPDIALDPGRVVATIGSEQIKASELEAKVGKEVKDASRDFVERIHSMRQGALEEILAGKLLALEAKAQNTTVEALTKAEVDDKTQAPPEEELRGFYDRFVRNRFPVSFEDARPQILQEMSGQARAVRRAQYLETLKAKYKVVESLPPPAVPRVQVAATGPAKGPQGAKVTIVEFSDFQCPFCSRAKETADKVVQTYGDKVRLVFRHYPLPFHDQAEGAARAGICADQQQQFWAMHDKMFANQDKLDPASLKGFAKELGLDTAKFEKCLDAPETAAALAKDKSEGEAAGVQGTPAFFINGRLLAGAQPFEAFQAAIDAELAGAK